MSKITINKDKMKREKAKIDCVLRKFGIPYFWNTIYLQIGDKLNDYKMSSLYQFMRRFFDEEARMISDVHSYEFDFNGKLRKKAMKFEIINIREE